MLLGTASTEENTKTLTHTLWSLLNLLPARSCQPPHRHNSVALDLAVSAPATGCYTLMGPELGDNGWVKDPVRADWEAGAVFSTPPGWWCVVWDDMTCYCCLTLLVPAAQALAPQ